MADVQLSVEIVARLDQLSDNLNAATKGFTRFDKDAKNSLKKVDKDVKDLASSIEVQLGNKAPAAMKKLAVQAQNSLGGVKTGSNQAAFALTNLGRVAQDAPFGFIGIQNNLNPLLESFQRLKQESGSTGGALKALAQSLMGPAGIGIALSVVSSAILFYQQYLQRTKTTTDDVKKSTDDYVNSLGQIEQAQLKGAQNSQLEITKLKLVYDATQNTTLSIEQRNKAIDSLQETFPSYFGDLTNEEILAGKGADAYKRLTASIISTAKARAASELIAKNSNRADENAQKITDLQKEQLKIQREGNKVAREAGAYNPYGSSAGVGASLSTPLKVAEVQKTINNLKTDTEKLNAKNLLLETAITAEVIKGANILDPKTTSGGGPKPKPKKDEPVFERLGKLDFAKITADVNLSTQAFTSLGAAVENIDFNTPLAALNQFTQSINEIISSGSFDLLSSLGRSIGVAFAEGSDLLAAAGQSILSSIGAILVNFGELTLAAGIAATALGTALINPTNPGAAIAAIAAGIALIAIGSAVSAFSANIGSGNGGANGGPVTTSNVPRFAEGGIVTGPTLAMVGDNPGRREAIIPIEKWEMLRGNNGQSVVMDTVIRGQDLVLVQRRANNAYSRTT